MAEVFGVLASARDVLLIIGSAAETRRHIPYFIAERRSTRGSATVYGASSDIREVLDEANNTRDPVDRPATAVLSLTTAAGLDCHDLVTALPPTKRPHALGTTREALEIIRSQGALFGELDHPVSTLVFELRSGDPAERQLATGARAAHHRREEQRLVADLNLIPISDHRTQVLALGATDTPLRALVKDIAAFHTVDREVVIGDVGDRPGFARISGRLDATKAAIELVANSCLIGINHRPWDATAHVPSMGVLRVWLTPDL